MLRMMTLNLNQFGDKHGAWEIRLERVLQTLRLHAPDIAAFQAVGAETGIAAGKDQARQIAACLPEYSQVWFQAAQRSGDDKLQGSAFLSRAPLVPVGHQELPFEDNTEDGNRRLLLHARAQNGAEPLELINAHFSWVPQINQANVAAALSYLQTLTGPVLLAGDLNAPPDSAGMRLLADAGWTDAWALLHPDDPGYTFEADHPAQRIDYVWANQAAVTRLRTIERIVPEGDARLSDHLGLLVTLE
ncbi:MAG TPA: endonuclease/exonuclease/phosphatase family protein [Gammaproteobacteria bacterium]